MNKIEEVLDKAKISKDRMFPILNKIDRIWLAHHELPFCELIKLINIKDVDDVEFTKNLDTFIETNNIK